MENLPRSSAIAAANARMKEKNTTKPPSAPAYSTPRRSVWILIALTTVSAAVAVAVFRPWPLSPASKVEASLLITSFPRAEAAEAAASGPAVPIAAPAPAPLPDGMVWIPGGEFSMGAIDLPASEAVGIYAAADVRPIHRLYVDGLWTNQTDVTNEEFARFDEATGCVAV